MVPPSICRQSYCGTSVETTTAILGLQLTRDPSGSNAVVTSAAGARRFWLRGLLFSVLAAPLLGALLASATIIFVRWLPDGMLPPSIPMVVAIGITVSYVVSSGPALVAGIIWTTLALRWQRQGLSRRSIVVRLAVVGIALGVVAVLIGASLGEGRFVVKLQYVVPGAATGLLIGLAFPSVLWGGSGTSSSRRS